MNDRGYLERLQRDLPAWVENGWVTPEAGRAILERAAADGGSRFLGYALAVLGVLLLGSGVIAFFAANWGIIPKAAKLAILFGAMWAAYAGGGAFLRRDRAAPGHALVLLGVVLFGANIALIAQIYHIDARYPDGVALWSAGALLAAWLARSAPALVLGLVLALLWSGMETYGFDAGVHWPFFALWLPALWLVHRQRSRIARHALLATLLLWCVNVFFAVAGMRGEWTSSDRVYLVQFFLLAYLALYILGRVMAWYPRVAVHSVTVAVYAVFAALTSFFLLTFPEFERAGRGGAIGGREPATAVWTGLTLAAAAFVAGLIVWRYHDTRLADLPRYRRWGLGLLGAGLAAFVANLFVSGIYVGAMTIAFNVVFLATLVWLLNTGVDRAERVTVNLAFLFFGAWLLARYFDAFWTLLGRSFFFMTGGAILLAGGYFLERRRRRLVAGMTTPPGSRGTA